MVSVPKTVCATLGWTNTGISLLSTACISDNYLHYHSSSPLKGYINIVSGKAFAITCAALQKQQGGGPYQSVLP